MNSDITKDMIAEVIDSDEEVPKDVAIANKVVAAGLLHVSHGDAVHWLGQGYRNEKLLFWHKNKASFTRTHASTTTAACHHAFAWARTSSPTTGSTAWTISRQGRVQFN